MIRSRRCRFLIPLIVLVASPLQAQQAAQPACDAAPYRGFDFWIGEWEVYSPQGTLAGHSVIRAIHGGCAIEENWRGAGGVTGSSLNAYDATTGTWRQSWVDSSGMVLELEGGREGAAMVMRGSVRNADGTTSLHRITWSPRDGGTVHQQWDVSGDGGATWSVLFAGTYRTQSGAR